MRVVLGCEVVALFAVRFGAWLSSWVMTSLLEARMVFVGTSLMYFCYIL